MRPSEPSRRRRLGRVLVASTTTSLPTASSSTGAAPATLPSSSAQGSGTSLPASAASAGDNSSRSRCWSPRLAHAAHILSLYMRHAASAMPAA